MEALIKKRIEQAAREIVELSQFLSDFPHDKESVVYGALEMAKWLLSHQWISVEEAFPECDKCHLAMYEDGGIIVAKYKNETWWWQDGYVVGRNTDGDFMYSSSCKVPSSLITHWMMIPTINKEEK